MAIFYLDYENGNDANDGSNWANAWKTITSGATAARIAPGDTIRIAKSPDPVSLGINATWTDLSLAVTLASALTANIYMTGSWTASANVTCTTSTTRKEGSYSSSIAIASGFTTGLAAYYATGTLDLSGYQKLSFWIRSSVAIASGVLTIDLCSDTAGATVVNSFAIPAIPGVNRWQCVTVDYGGALGSAIQSISINAISDPGTPTILIDNIIACNDLTLTSLISKNSAAYGGDEGWFGVKSINGTAVELDVDTNSQAGAGRGYSGATETVALYCRETIKTSAADTTSTQVQVVQDSGTAGSLIAFSGGWNTGTTTQDGETFFDGQNGNGYGVYLVSNSFVDVTRISVCRYNYGISYSSGRSNSVTVTNANNNSTYSIYYSGGSNNNTAVVTNVNNNSYGIYYTTGSSNNTAVVTNAKNNNNSGIHYSSSNNNSFTGANISNNGYGIYYTGSSNNTATVAASSGGTAGVYSDNGVNYLVNSTFSQATEFTGASDFANSRLFSHNHDATAGFHKIYTDGGLIASDTTTRHTASGISWKLSPSSTNRSASYPLDFDIAQISCVADVEKTVTCWFRRDNTGITGMLVLKGGQIAGVASNVTDSMTVAADTWEQLSITFTPTEDGVVNIQAWAYGGTTYSVYVDDLEVV